MPFDDEYKNLKLDEVHVFISVELRPEGKVLKVLFLHLLNTSFEMQPGGRIGILYYCGHLIKSDMIGTFSSAVGGSRVRKRNIFFVIKQNNTYMHTLRNEASCV